MKHPLVLYSRLSASFFHRLRSAVWTKIRFMKYNLWAFLRLIYHSFSEGILPSSWALLHLCFFCYSELVASTDLVRISDLEQRQKPRQTVWKKNLWHVINEMKQNWIHYRTWAVFEHILLARARVGGNRPLLFFPCSSDQQNSTAEWKLIRYRRARLKMIDMCLLTGNPVSISVR